MSDDLNLKVKITANSDEAEKAIDQLSTSIDDLGFDSQGAAGKLEQAEKAASDLSQEVDEVTNSIDDLVKKETDLSKLGSAFKSIGGDIQSLGARLTAVTAPLTIIAGLGLKNIFDIGSSIEASKGPFKDFADNVKTLKDNFTSLTIEVGEVLLPTFRSFINFANNLINYFKSLSDESKSLIIAVSAIAVALGPIVFMFGSLVTTIGSLMAVIGPLSAAIGAIASPIVAVGGLVASLIAGVAGLINIFLKLRESGVNAADAVKLSFELLTSTFTKFVIRPIVSGVAMLMEAFAKLASFGSKSISDGLRADAAEVKRIADSLSEPFDKAKKSIDDKLESIGSSAGDAFTFGISTKLTEMSDSLSDMFEMPDMTSFSNSNVEATNKAEEAYKSLKITVADVNREIENSFINTMTDGISGIIIGTKTLAQAFQDMTQKILQDLIRIMIQAQLTNAITGSLGAGGGGTAFSLFATGGYVSGPGSSMSDSIPARLSDGEYVVRASSVKKVGVGFLDYINNLGTRSFNKKVQGKFADGGSVSGGSTSGNGGVSVEIINNGTAKNSSDVNFDPEKMVVSVVLNDLSRNGSMSKAIGSTFGVRRSV